MLHAALYTLLYAAPYLVPTLLLVAYGLTESGSPLAARIAARRRAKASEARFAERARRLGLARPK